ncbi:MAG: glycosyltransferase [Lachnospiraceae bacterium]|nr:glycosyltransferase [Lachnospiraceae bacterium]
MIPKIIHYCWFGRNPIPADLQAYIDSWKTYCPDYEIMRWDEDSFDLTQYDFVREAYENRKWAFVTDVVRLWALYKYGGIYMDTDVEVLQPLDRFLSERGFSGFEKEDAVPTGIMAAEAGLPVIKMLLDDYEHRHFILPDGSMDLHTNVEDITAYFLERGLKLNNQKQTIDGFTLYPKDWFCPLDNRTFELKKTANTYTIHHFAGSWIEDQSKKRNRKIKKLLGPKLTGLIVRLRDLLGLSR